MTLPISFGIAKEIMILHQSILRIIKRSVFPAEREGH